VNGASGDKASKAGALAASPKVTAPELNNTFASDVNPKLTALLKVFVPVNVLFLFFQAMLAVSRFEVENVLVSFVVE